MDLWTAREKPNRLTLILIHLSWFIFSLNTSSHLYVIDLFMHKDSCFDLWAWNHPGAQSKLKVYFQDPSSSF